MIDPLAALRFQKPVQIALVGSGGKTTWMVRLARAFLQKHKTVLITTTTHLASWQAQLADHHLVVTSPFDLPGQMAGVPEGLVLVTGAELADDRLAGLDTRTMAGFQQLAHKGAYPLLVEADGSRQRPLKAPAQHEPVIPDAMDVVFVLAGLSGLDRPLNETWVHRPELFGALSGISAGEKITVSGLARVLSDPTGGLKGISEKSYRIALLTQANDPIRKSNAGLLAEKLLCAYDSVLIAKSAGTLEGDSSGDRKGALEREIQSAQLIAAHEGIAGVVLAGGGSTRFQGPPKQLLDWKGVPLVRHVALQAIAAGLSPVVVVTGANASVVEAALTGLDVTIAKNPAWERGQSTSIQAALRAFPPRVKAAIFLLVDQPQIPVTLIRALVERHRSTLAAVIAPLIDGDRGNPVLFDKRTFSDLVELTGDVGGRAVFSRYKVAWVPWHDARMRLDIDTETDYLKLVDEMGINPSTERSSQEPEG